MGAISHQDNVGDDPRSKLNTSDISRTTTSKGLICAMLDRHWHEPLVLCRWSNDTVWGSNDTLTLTAGCAPWLEWLGISLFCTFFCVRVGFRFYSCDRKYIVIVLLCRGGGFC